MRFIVLISSLGELMEDNMLHYYWIVLNINYRAYIYIYIYTKISRVCDSGFHVFSIRRTESAKTQGHRHYNGKV